MRRYRRLGIAFAIAAAVVPAALPGTAARATPPPPAPQPAQQHAGQHRVPRNFDEIDCEGPAEDRISSDDLNNSGSDHSDLPRRAAAPWAPAKWPKNIPDLDDAKRELGELKVRAFDSKGFERKKFGGSSCWVLHGPDKCSTRELALKAQSDIAVTTQGRCKVVSGRWHSAYDNTTLVNPLRVDIDHIVPLRVAWGSGGRNWPDYKRRAFANDLSASPQLIAVSTWSNREKGDKGPDKWLPKGYECLYSRAWIGVKDYYGLSVTQAEKRKLRQVLAGCKK